MLDQRVHVTQAGSQAEYLDIVHHGADSIHTALDVYAHHAAEAVVHLLLGDLMGGMALQARIVHAIHLGMLLKMTGHLHGILAVTLHANAQSLHTLHQLPCGKGIQHSAEALQIGHPAVVDALLGAGNDTGGDGAVAIEVLGSAVDHQVSTQIQRILKVGGRKGAVHDHSDAGVLMYRLGDSGNVADLQGGVGRSFNIHQRGVRLDSLFHFLDLSGVHAGISNAQLGQDLGKQRIGAAVNDIAEHHVVTGLYHAHDSGGNGTQTRGQGQRCFGVLQMGDLALQFIAVGIGETGVGEAGVSVLIQIYSSIKVLQHIGGSLIDRADMGHGYRLIRTPQFGMKLFGMQQVGINAHNNSPFRHKCQIYLTVYGNYITI